jgi:RNA polymerase sigma factor (sigma-70 family)
VTELITPTDRAEIEACFTRLSPAVYRFLLGYTCHDRELAKDLVQTTFMKAVQDWSKLRDLSDENRLKWLYDVAAKSSIDIFRKNATVRKKRSFKAYFQYRESNPHHDAMISIAIQRFIEVLDAMPKQRRLVAFLRWRCEWKNSEIAEALAITPSAVSQHLGAAQATLKAELRDHVPFEPGDDGEGGGA